MLLQNNLYHIAQTNGSQVTIGFNASHPVFQGHFPGHPIVPGACLVQIAEELKSIELGQKVVFDGLYNLKFRQPVTPDMEVVYTMQDTKYEILDKSLTQVYAQFKATYMCPGSDL